MITIGAQAVLVFGLLAATPQVSTGPATTPETTPVAATPEKKICKPIVPLGTIMAKRFCLTKAEWRQFDGINEASADYALQRRHSGRCDVNCKP
jgi:hypothetical protein